MLNISFLTKIFLFLNTIFTKSDLYDYLTDIKRYSIRFKIKSVKEPNDSKSYKLQRLKYTFLHENNKFKNRRKFLIKDLNIHSMELNFILINLKIDDNRQYKGKLWFVSLQNQLSEIVKVKLYAVDNYEEHVVMSLAFKIKMNIVTANEINKKNINKNINFNFRNEIKKSFQNDNSFEKYSEIFLKIISSNEKFIKPCDGSCGNSPCNVLCLNGKKKLPFSILKHIVELQINMKLKKFKKVENKKFISIKNNSKRKYKILYSNLIKKETNFILVEKDKNEAILCFKSTDFKKLGISYFEYSFFSGVVCLNGSKTSLQSFMENHWKIIKPKISKYKKFTITGYSNAGAISTMLHYLIEEKQLLNKIKVCSVNFAGLPVFYNNSTKSLKLKNSVNYVFGTDVIPSFSYATFIDFIKILDSLKNDRKDDIISENSTEIENNFTKRFHSVVLHELFQNTFAYLTTFGKTIVIIQSQKNGVYSYYYTEEEYVNDLHLMTTESIKDHSLLNFYTAFKLKQIKSQRDHESDRLKIVDFISFFKERLRNIIDDK